MRMTGPRAMIAVATVLTALIVQVAFLARLDLPGATPNLVLVVVLVLAAGGGPMMGTVVGFSAGVLVDLAPPAAGAVGQTAAVFAVAGFVAGHLTPDLGKPALDSVLSVAGLCGAALFGQVLISAIIGIPEVTWTRVPLLLATEVGYSAVLAIAVLPGIGLLYRGAVEEGRTV